MLISIIIPVYNARSFLPRCVDSIIAQTFKDWEMILVDDGSTDGTAAICDQYTSKDKRITVIHQTNSGPSAARNNGITKAHGKYVSFVDADDWMDETQYADYAVALDTEDYDIIFQGFIREFNDNRTEKSFAFDSDTKSLNKEDILCKLYKNHVFGWAWCKIFKRDIIEKNCLKFDEGLTLWEDELFTIQFMKVATCIKTIDCHHYHYIHYPESLMNTKNTPLRRLALSEIMNNNLKDLANEELLAYIEDNYNHNLKFDLLMALMNKPTHRCTEEQKNSLLKKYYSQCQQYPDLKWQNVLKNRLSYSIAEALLMTHCHKLITSVFAILG